MTKAEIIESVLLKVSAGRLSADIDVRREDISVLVDGVLAEVLSEESDNDLRRDILRMRNYGAPGTDTVAQFAISKTITPVEDEDRELYYLDVGGKVFFGGGKNGVVLVKPIKGKMVYRPARNQSVISSIPDDMGVFFFWPENVGGTTYVYLSATSTPICDYLVRVYINPGDLENDDELPIPDSVTMEAIRRLVKHFRPEFVQDQEITDTDETRGMR